MKYKKGEGRISSWLIVLIIGLSLMMWFSALLSDLVQSYGKENIDDFDYYEDEYENIKTATERIIGSQENLTLQIDENDQWEDVLYKKAYNVVNPLWQKITSVPSKAVGGVQIALGSVGMFTSTINIMGKTDLFGLQIPFVVKTMVLLVIGLTIVIMGVSAYMKWKL